MNAASIHSGKTRVASASRLLLAVTATLIAATALLASSAAFAVDGGVTSTYSDYSEMGADGRVVSGQPATSFQSYSRASLIGSIAELDPSVIALSADQLIERSALIRRVVLACILLGIGAVALTSWLFPRIAQLVSPAVQDMTSELGAPRPASPALAGDPFASAQFQYGATEFENLNSGYQVLANTMHHQGSIAPSRTHHHR